MPTTLAQQVAEFRAVADEVLQNLNRLSDEQRALIERIIARVDAEEIQKLRSSLHGQA